MTKENITRLLEIAERCEKAVEFLATVPMELGLARWSAESSNILECAAALRAQAEMEV